MSIKNITFVCENRKCKKTFRQELETLEDEKPKKGTATVEEEYGYYGAYDIYIKTVCPHCKDKQSVHIYNGQGDYCYHDDY